MATATAVQSNTAAETEARKAAADKAAAASKAATAAAIKLTPAQKATAKRRAEKAKALATAEALKAAEEKIAVTVSAPAVVPMFSDTVTEPAVDTASDEVVVDTEPELDVPPEIVDAKGPRMSVKAHLVSGKTAMVALTPDMLKALAFISTYSTQDEQSTSPRQHGYQREPMEARFPGIARYYKKGENRHRIPPIIASVRVYTLHDQARFDKMFEDGDIAGIHKAFGKSVFSIVDGQHRLGGLHYAWDTTEGFNPDVPVMVFYGLRYEDEANLFDDINTNQRKLPKALIEATKVHMEAGEKTHAQQIREIAFALSQDGDSVWHGLVNMTGARDPMKPVTYEGLRRATSNMFHERLIGRLENRNFLPDEVSKAYWVLVSKACAPAWNNQTRVVKNEEGEQVEEKVKYRLKDLVGVAAISRLGQDVLTTALEKSKTTEDFWSEVANLVSKLGQIDWEKRESNPWMRSGAGFAGMGKLYLALYDLVYLNKAPGEAVAPDEA